MRIVPVLLAAVLVPGAAACSTADHSATPNPRPAPSQAKATAAQEVQILRGKRFSPTQVALKVGQSVLVTDTDSSSTLHNFTVDGVGHSETMRSGDTFTLRFDKAGTYGFVCTFHEQQGMTGTVTVS